VIAFWLIAAALAAAALYVVLRPLVAPRGGAPLSRREANIAIYRDELRELGADLAAGTLAREDYERSRLELEARALEDLSTEEPIATRGGGRHAALALGVALPVLALVVYLAAGTPGALAPQTAVPTAAQVEGMVARLAAKLEENPGDVEGWKLLGRSYMVLGRYPQAVGAYAKAAERAPRDAQLLADFADALAMARGQRLAGEPERLIARALEIDPGNLKALALAGSAAFERQDYARAAELWSRMLPLVPAGSEEARSIAENVEEAKKLASIGASSPDTASAHPGVRGTVRLAPALRQQVRPGDTVFVFARAAEGPAMPLAVLRARAADLPLQFALNDSMAMARGLTVSAHPRVVVTARVSKSGSAKPAPGDLQGASGPVANNASGVAVTIDSVVR
jgi:cytochrome c-type biogenesis protein CcmH